MVDRGFDLDEDVAGPAPGDPERTLGPVDRIAERGYFAAPPSGKLPVLPSEESLVFGSDNYLGLTADGRVQDAARRAVATVGTGAGASRVRTGDTVVHHDLERMLAETVGTDRALAFATGDAAAVAPIAALEPDVVFSDAANRASVVDGCRRSGAETVVYDHCDVPGLRTALAERADGDAGDESWLIVTASVFGDDGAVAPLSAICDAATEFGAWVMVDERHATGLYVDGGGVVQAEGLADRIDVLTGAFSTALASQGGYVAGSDALIDRVIARADAFAAATGLAPAAVAAASEALHVARHGDCRQALWENVAHLRDGLESMGYDVRGDSQILPVRVVDHRDAEALATGLRERGVVAPAIRPAAGADESVVRATPMATHDREDIVRCLEAFQLVGEEVGLL